MRRATLIPLSSLLLLLPVPPEARAGGCSASLVIQHSRPGTPEGGAIDLAGTGYSGKGNPGPEIRFWSFGSFESANNGAQPQVWEKGSWLLNLAVDRKIAGQPPSHVVVRAADWYGNKVKGCPLGGAEKPAGEKGTAAAPRTVVEMSFADPAREGSREHQGYYLVMSVPLDERRGSFDLSAVRGGSGQKGNVVAVAAVPAPKLSEVKAASGGQMRLRVELPAPVSYSEGGKDAPVRLISGYRLLYAAGAEPTSSDPAKYQPVRDPKDPKRELGVVGSGVVELAVPAEKDVWLVAQIVYNDPSTLYSRATSAHVAAAAAAGGPAASGRRRTTDPGKDQ